MMDALRFRNIIAGLFNIDRDVLENAGIIDVGPSADIAWDRFCEDPARFTLRLSDDDLGKLWSVIEARQKPVAEDRSRYLLSEIIGTFHEWDAMPCASLLARLRGAVSDAETYVKAKGA